MFQSLRPILRASTSQIPALSNATRTRHFSTARPLAMADTASASASAAGTPSASASKTTPVEDLIRERITNAFAPTFLSIRNDSAKHAHHMPMRGSTSAETHFYVQITSPAFAGMNQPARHRAVYKLLADEMSRPGGVHALQLRTKTPEEIEREERR